MKADLRPDRHLLAAVAATSSPPSSGTSVPLSAEQISAASLELGFELSSAQADVLAGYAALLLRWNAVHNLTAIRSPAEVLTHHLLDSLSIVPEVKRIASVGAQVLDVGAGGGLPGIPLAVALPHLRITLLDKVRKKVAFLSQARLELALTNVECLHGRVEELAATPPFDLIVSRAFASLPELVRLTRHALANGGWWCAMKGTRPTAELDALKTQAPDVRVVDQIRLRVPHLDAERHLILLQVG